MHEGHEGGLRHGTLRRVQRPCGRQADALVRDAACAGLDGKTVETIENAPNDAMLPMIQRSFLDVGAVQCGFCTPGMVMATKALLLHHPAPTEPEICDGLKNNYCRCTGYVKIIEAVKLAAARLRGEDPDIDSFRTPRKHGYRGR